MQNAKTFRFEAGGVNLGTKILFAQTILDKKFRTKWRIPVKLYRTRKV